MTVLKWPSDFGDISPAMLPVVSHEVKTGRWLHATIAIIGVNLLVFLFELSRGRAVLCAVPAGLGNGAGTCLRGDQARTTCSPCSRPCSST